MATGQSHKVKKVSRPSDRLNPKTVDPFASEKTSSSAFASVYNSGRIPCRLVHGSVKHKLSWSQPLEEVEFDPVLIALAEGIKETIHPYSFVAREGFQELLTVHDANVKTLPLLPKLTNPIRAALNSADNPTFHAGLKALLQLSEVVGTGLNPHLKSVLVPISRRMMNKQSKDEITAALQNLARAGGKEALLIIKQKIPTFTCV